MRNIGHFIGGKHVAGKSGRTADVFQPLDGSVQAKVALATKDEVRAAVENAKAAQPACASSSNWSKPNMTALPSCWRANTARPLPTPRAIFSAASKWWKSASARHIC